MAFAPRHDWDFYEARTALPEASAWSDRSLADRYAWYVDALNLILTVQRDNPAWRQLEDDRWQAKLAMRTRLIEALRKHGKLVVGPARTADAG